MSIICFEGASAVGKTTTAQVFEENHKAFIIPEINLLFDRPKDELTEWYFERQVERSVIAREQSKNYELVILDGDPFQPLWYSWAYDYAGWQSLDFMEQFYRAEIQNKTIYFPDLYFVFNANEAELRKRKAGDVTRQRRGFETNLKMIEPQCRYFEAFSTFSPNSVYFLEAETVETNVKFVQERTFNSPIHHPIQSEVVFEKIIEWLRMNNAWPLI